MLAWEADLPLDDTIVRGKGTAFCEADDAGFAAAVRLYAVLDSEKLVDECFCHWEQTRVSLLWAGMDICWKFFPEMLSWGR